MPIKYTTLAIYLIPFALGLTAGYFLFGNTETVKVKVPAIVGSISPAPITYLEPKGEPLRIIWRDKVIERKNPVNDSLFKAYTDLENKFKDQELELEQLKMYIDAITIRQFESQFEDPFLKLKVKGTVQGRLKNIEISHYEIKEREIEVRKKPFSLSVFGGYGVSKTGLSPVVGIGLSYAIWEF